MITFLDEYRKSAQTSGRSRASYLDPTSRAEAVLSERWTTAERLMRLFKLSWSQAIGMASRMDTRQAPKLAPDPSCDDAGADTDTSPARGDALASKF